MKTKKTLKSYFKKRTDAIERLLKKPDKQYTVEDYHKLRVEIKKMRALAVLLESSVKNFKSKKILKPVNKIFSQAGKVRELQLEESMLRKYDTQHRLRIYPANLNVRELKEKKDFSGMREKTRGELKKIVGRIDPVIGKVNQRDINKYVARQKKEISGMVKRGKLKTSQLHELRKGLKRFYYTLKSLDIKDNSRAFKNGDMLQELMGKWHDMRVMNNHLLKAGDKHLSTISEEEPIRQIADELNAQSQVLYTKINTEKQKKLF